MLPHSHSHFSPSLPKQRFHDSAELPHKARISVSIGPSYSSTAANASHVTTSAVGCMSRAVALWKVALFLTSARNTYTPVWLK